jgi:glucose/arabinose dehydrogenase
MKLGATRRSLVAATAAVLLIAATVTSTSASFTPGVTRIALRPVASGFNDPVFVTGAGDGSGRLFVVEQGGTIRVVKNGTVLPTPFLDVSGSISHGGEQGLLGLAFHPDFSANHKLYVYFTTTSGSIAVNEYRVTTNADQVAPGTGRRIITIAHPNFDNHNGGMLAFGPDRYLYMGTGDGGSGGDPNNNAQNVNSLLGKLLRLSVDSSTHGLAYGIPPTNPYVGVAGRDEIFARGLRNPWRFSFDSLTGDLWIGDVGQNQWEEIDRSMRSSGGGRGANYGWRVMEGRHCYNATTCSSSGKTLPIVEYSHAEGCSVTGGYVYRGTMQPNLANAYFFADFCSGRIWAVRANDGSPAARTQVLDTSLMISSFGRDDRGELYVVGWSNGTIYRIVARRTPTPN